MKERIRNIMITSLMTNINTYVASMAWIDYKGLFNISHIKYSRIN